MPKPAIGVDIGQAASFQTSGCSVVPRLCVVTYIIPFREELVAILTACDPRPETRFCIAIEEGEAWLLGDNRAVKAAYPSADGSVLRRYSNDVICGTWELLADAVYRGGAEVLKRAGWQAVGREKEAWAQHIAPHVDVERNASPSFQYFREVGTLTR